MAVMPAETRRAIVEDLRAGKSQYGTAKRHGVNQGTVSKIAKAEGIDGIYAAPKKAVQTKQTFDMERRLEINDRIFARVAGEIDTATIDELNKLTMTYAVLTDKRRLEEGKATDRHEHIDSARDDVARRVDELTARRGARGVVRESDGTPSEATGS